MRRGAPPDPALIDYLRRHLPRFGETGLRGKLLEEGVDVEEIEAALAALRTKTARKPFSAGSRWLPYILFGVAALTATVYLAIDSPGPAKNPLAPDGAFGTPEEPAARTFLGHYGYVLQIPDGYRASAGFKGPQRTLEVVHLAPKGTDPTHFANEGLYGPLGILRLEVQPRRIPEGRIGIEAVRSGVTATLQSRRAVFSTRDLQAGGMPAFLVTVTAPFPMVQAFVVGSRVLYVFTGGSESPAFTEVLLSLNEAAPRERPSPAR